MVEQPLRLTFGQRRRGLVKDEDTGVARQRASDDDELLGGQVERTHPLAGVEVGAEFG